MIRLTIDSRHSLTLGIHRRRSLCSLRLPHYLHGRKLILPLVFPAANPCLHLLLLRLLTINSRTFKSLSRGYFIFKHQVPPLQLLFHQGSCVSDLGQLYLAFLDEEGGEHPLLVVLVVLGLVFDLEHFVLFKQGFDHFLAKLQLPGLVADVFQQFFLLVQELAFQVLEFRLGLLVLPVQLVNHLALLVYLFLQGGEVLLVREQLLFLQPLLF